MSQQVIIFDTTLRDGEQALQASLSVKEKIQIALALERMGVDVMEVGFPVSSPGDFESVQTIARQIKNSRVCGLARCVDKDIDVAAEALRVAEAFRIHVFLATSTLHIESKLKRSFDEVLEMAVRSVKRARNYTDDVEFSCEDAGRTPIDNLCRVVEAAINAGATTINIPDTVGYTTPNQFGGIIMPFFSPDARSGGGVKPVPGTLSRFHADSAAGSLCGAASALASALPAPWKRPPAAE